MKELRIIDIIKTPNAILHKFGMVVFEEAKKHIQNGEKVTLSFEGLKGITTAFCHASIGNIYETFGENTPNIFRYTGVNGNDIWENKIQEAIYFATNSQAKAEHEQWLNQLFE